MDPQTPPLTISIQAIQNAHLQFPRSMELVSGVYSVVLPQRFSHPITMEVQHCASLEHPQQLSSLTFVSADSTQGMPPYHFQLLPGGIFPANSCYGSIHLRHSCRAAIVSDGSTKTYRALTYYIPQTATTWLVHFIIIRDLDLYLQVCSASLCQGFVISILLHSILSCHFYSPPLHLQCVGSHYFGEGIKAGPNLKMSFTGDEIKLDIPDVGIILPSGWSLQPLENPRVSNILLFYFASLPPLLLPCIHFNHLCLLYTFQFSLHSCNVTLWTATNQIGLSLAVSCNCN